VDFCNTLIFRKNKNFGNYLFKYIYLIVASHAAAYFLLLIYAVIFYFVTRADQNSNLS
jgi:hypothetical protein